MIREGDPWRHLPEDNTTQEMACEWEISWDNGLRCSKPFYKVRPPRYLSWFRTPMSLWFMVLITNYLLGLINQLRYLGGLTFQDMIGKWSPPMYLLNLPPKRTWAVWSNPSGYCDILWDSSHSRIFGKWSPPLYLPKPCIGYCDILGSTNSGNSGIATCLRFTSRRAVSLCRCFCDLDPGSPGSPGGCMRRCTLWYITHHCYGTWTFYRSGYIITPHCDRTLEIIVSKGNPPLLWP